MNKDIPEVEKLSTTQLVIRDPVLACSYIQAKFDALLKFILSDANPIGSVTPFRPHRVPNPTDATLSLPILDGNRPNNWGW